MILESLPDWFGIPEAREAYIAGSKGKSFFCAVDGEKPLESHDSSGFLQEKAGG